MGRLVILTGPSCVGKSPLKKALLRLHPELHDRLQPVVLVNSRAPRPGERDGHDYHFRTREALLAVVALLEGRAPAGVERWPAELLPSHAVA